MLKSLSLVVEVQEQGTYKPLAVEELVELSIVPHNFYLLVLLQ
jgi:hypothetical protein